MRLPKLHAQHHPICYPSTREKALAFFQKAALLAKSPPQNEPCPGVITPHIDFRVSLKAYAEAFAPLFHQPLASTYLILGVGHRSHLEWNLDQRDYDTPLGSVPCDVQLVDRLAAGSSSKQIFEPAAHEGEHSIEFALVWLQALHALRGWGQGFHFVPLLCGGMHRYVEGETDWTELDWFHQLAKSLDEIMQERGDDLRIIVSIDGCHLGPRFDHPFRVNPGILEDTAKWEHRLWENVAQSDARVFLDWMRTEGNARYFDGVGALALLLAALGKRGKIQRIYYEQWFTKDDASAVTFSSGLILPQHSAINRSKRG